jgi:hypothetical protein
MSGPVPTKARHLLPRGLVSNPWSQLTIAMPGCNSHEFTCWFDSQGPSSCYSGRLNQRASDAESHDSCLLSRSSQQKTEYKQSTVASSLRESWTYLGRQNLGGFSRKWSPLGTCLSPKSSSSARDAKAISRRKWVILFHYIFIVYSYSLFPIPGKSADEVELIQT